MSNQRLAQARLTACRRWPAATSAILSLIPVERRGLGTLGVDKHWRLYFDPKYLAEQPDDELVGLILHEVSHLLLKHHQRRGGRDAELWNIAADLAVNYRLQLEGHPLPPGGMFCKDFQLPGNLSAEQYYRHLEDRKNVERERAADTQAQESDEPADENGSSAGDAPECEDDNSGSEAEGEDSAEGSGGEGDESGAGDGQPAEGAASGDGADGSGQSDPDGAGDGPGGASGEKSEGPATGVGQGVSPGTSGSCSDGILKPWEDPPEATEGSAEAPPAIQQHEAEQIIQIVAQQTEKACGGGKGNGWAEWAGNILHPKIDPKQLLISAIRKAADQMSGGHDDTSYRRPSRRPQAGGVIRPGRVAIVPRICLIIDSSGSMDQRDLGLALGMVSKVLSGFRLRDGVKVMVGDTCCQSAEKVFDPKKIEIVGRGGTDMAALIEHAAKEINPKPQLIVLVTDGETDYPHQSVGIPTVVCLTRKPTSCSMPPAWIKSIVLNA